LNGRVTKLQGVIELAYSDDLWAECKKKCRLNMEDIALAKKLGLNPRSLIKNIPSKSQPWKAPVKDWLHDLIFVCTKKGSFDVKKGEGKTSKYRLMLPKDCYKVIDYSEINSD